MPRPVIARRSALLIMLAAALAPSARAAPAWVEGRSYERLDSPQHTSVAPGKVEVLEVFSYGCPACNQFQPTIERLRHDLPLNAELALLPASLNPAEDWPMLQRAYFTALSLGVAERTHQGIFDAIWKTRELAIVDPATNRLKSPLPSIEDAARVYEKIGGVSADRFLQVARSFGVDARMRAADAKIMAMQVHSTPTLIVNGRYRVIRESDSYGDLISLIRHLVSMESAH